MITGDGLKTLDAVRDTFTVHEIDATAASFETAAIEQPVGAL